MAPLTPRQQQVVSLIGAGMQYKTIAHELRISVVMVKLHAHRAAERLPKPYLTTKARIIDWYQAQG